MTLTRRIFNQYNPKCQYPMLLTFLVYQPQAVHKQIKLKNIICPKLGNKLYLTYKQARQLFNIPFQHKVIVGQIVKGGLEKRLQ